MLFCNFLPPRNSVVNMSAIADGKPPARGYRVVGVSSHIPQYPVLYIPLEQ